MIPGDDNLERVKANAERAETEDLLDRVTVYREEMEPDAVFLFEDELRRRGVTPAEIDAHGRRREAEGMVRDDGVPLRCQRCDRPAAERRWGWHRLWGVLPVFPRRIASCAAHRAGGTTSPAPGSRPPRPA